LVATKGDVVEPVRAVIELGNSFLLWLGGGGVVIAAVCAFISKTVADYSIESHKNALSTELERIKGELAMEGETHKLALRKKELLFDRQMQVASAFIHTSHKLRPEYRFPDMDYYDASVEVAQRLGEVEAELTRFQLAHGAAITSDARVLLSAAITRAAHNKFEGDEIEPSEQAIKAGDELLKKLQPSKTS
jgi:hypothetical protein